MQDASYSDFHKSEIDMLQKSIDQIEFEEGGKIIVGKWIILKSYSLIRATLHISNKPVIQLDVLLETFGPYP